MATNSSNTPSDDDLYLILGVTPEATDADIRKAYRKKVLILHPDKQPPNTNHEQVHEAFTRLQNAYETLRDTRAEYDAKVRKKHCSSHRHHSAGTSQNRHASSSAPPTRDNQNQYSNYAWSDYSSKSRSSGTNKQRHQKQNPEPNKWNSQYRRYHSSSEKQSNQGQKSTDNQHGRSYNSTSSSSERQSNQRQQSSNGFYPKTGPSQRSSYPHSNTYSSNHKKTNSKTKKPNNSQHQNHNTTRDEDKKENSKARKTFGVTSNGEPCKRCMQQGQYCWQHEGQKNKNYTNHSSKPYPSAPGVAKESTRIWGVTSEGKPCQRCLNEKGYCWQHEWQNAQNHPAKGKCSYGNIKPHPTGVSSTPKAARIWGVTANGKPCQKCSQQGGYCWQHQCQDIRNYTSPRSEEKNGGKREKTKHSKACYGVTQKGLPCRRCIFQGGFCHQHMGQKCQ